MIAPRQVTRPSVLITGSSRGLGRCLAEIFGARGYDVIVHGTDVKQLAEVRDAVLAHGTDCESVSGDLACDATLDRLSSAARRRNLDVLITNAALYRTGSLAETPPADVRRVLEVNLIAPILLVQRVWPLFVRRQSGLVVNINSQAGREGSAGEAIYAASKHGLRGLLQAVRFDAIQEGIRILDVYLGAMNTGMTQGRRDPALCIQPEEAADVICSLATARHSLRVDEIHLNRCRY